jgi:Rrf2 family iron-sulfur cluster assembly transcriptional regulator
LTNLVGINISHKRFRVRAGLIKPAFEKREKNSLKLGEAVKLTAKGRYAVMAVADMAAQGVDARCSLAEISARQGISLSFLEQLFAKLRRAGIVESRRGASGGYVLTQAPQALTLERVIFAVDEDIKAHGCSPETKIACTGRTAKCLTHNLWGALENHIENFLASITVQDVVDGRFPAALEAAE